MKRAFSLVDELPGLEHKNRENMNNPTSNAFSKPA
jgi:hypothetical protein